MAKAIVFLWDGHNVDDSTVKNMASVLVDSGACIPELLKARVYDNTGIADALVQSCANIKCTTSNTETAKADEAIKNAIVYMETKFPSMNRSYVEFAVDLASALQDNASRELYAAIHIIATANPNSKRLSKLRKIHLDVIRNMYTRHKSIIDNYVS